MSLFFLLLYKEKSRIIKNKQSKRGVKSMDFPYSIKDISSRVKKTEQSLYNLIKKNQEFIKQNSRKKGRFIKYNQAVMDWFIDYYGAAQEEPEQAPTQEQPETAQEGRQEASSNPVEDLSCQLLQAKIEALEALNAELRDRIAFLEKERRDLQAQVGLSLDLLKREKEEKEKILLLPPPQPEQPRKTFAEKVLGLFSNKKTQDNGGNS